MLDLRLTDDEACRALRAWDVGELLAFPGERGGTANPAVVLDATAGRFFLKRRNPRYSAPEVLRHDHALLAHLAAAGLPTPVARTTRGGEQWSATDEGVYELYPYLPGAAHDPTSEAQVRQAGRALARFHEATHDFAPPPGKAWPRYHDPEHTLDALTWALGELADRDKPTPGGRRPEEARAEIGELLELTRDLAASFPSAAYSACEHVTVHGDWHPGNVKYRGSEVAGIFDLDWATRQPKLVDLADGVVFFAGLRPTPLDPADIRSLTQPFELSPERTGAFLAGYGEVAGAAAPDLPRLPQFMQARWLWCRADPMRRKVPRAEAIDFLLDGLWPPLLCLRQTDPSHTPVA